MTIQAWLNHALNCLKPASDSYRLDAELLLSNELNLSRTQLLSEMDVQLTTRQLEKLNHRVTRRINGEPVAYIIGSIEFYGLTLSVDQRVLCPRPETETLVERIIKNAPSSSHVIDVGTGSGAIAVAIKAHRPDLFVTATDISSKALDAAKENITAHKLDIKTQQSDLLNNIKSADIVVANLPYLPDDQPLDESVKAEPRQALVSSDGGLHHYQKLFKQAAQKSQITRTFIEAPPSQKDRLTNIAAASGFTLRWDKNYSLEFERT